MSLVASSIIRKENGRKCWWHIWWVNKLISTSVTTYEECLKCGSRKIEQTTGGYQPIDYDWLLGNMRKKEENYEN